jgi:folate-binding protein YgfZ
MLRRADKLSSLFNRSTTIFSQLYRSRFYSTNGNQVVRLNKNLIAISGPDTLKFLNGVVTNTLNEQNATFAAFLNSKGRLLADAFLYPVTESRLRPDIAEAAEIPSKYENDKIYLVEVDSALRADIVAMLNIHKLRAKVHISPLDPTQFGSFSIWDDQSPRALANSVSRLRDEHEVIAFNDPRAPGFGIRVICGEKDFALNNIYQNIQHLHIPDYRIRRYLYGIPEGSEELPYGSALPLESSIDYMNGINFDKGCYVGQELTIRSYHHGIIRKRILPVVFSDNESQYDGLQLAYDPESIGFESKLLIGSSISNLSGEDVVNQLADLGKINSPSPFGPSVSSRRSARPSGVILATAGNVGLALVRLDHFAQPKARFGVNLGDKQVFVRGFIPFWWPE